MGNVTKLNTITCRGSCGENLVISIL